MSSDRRQPATNDDWLKVINYLRRDGHLEIPTTVEEFKRWLLAHVNWAGDNLEQFDTWTKEDVQTIREAYNMEHPPRRIPMNQRWRNLIHNLREDGFLEVPTNVDAFKRWLVDETDWVADEVSELETFDQYDLDTIREDYNIYYAHDNVTRQQRLYWLTQLNQKQNRRLPEALLDAEKFASWIYRLGFNKPYTAENISAFVATSIQESEYYAEMFADRVVEPESTSMDPWGDAELDIARDDAFVRAAKETRELRRQKMDAYRRVSKVLKEMSDEEKRIAAEELAKYGVLDKSLTTKKQTRGERRRAHRQRLEEQRQQREDFEESTQQLFHDDTDFYATISVGDYEFQKLCDRFRQELATLHFRQTVDLKFIEGLTENQKQVIEDIIKDWWVNTIGQYSESKRLQFSCHITDKVTAYNSDWITKTLTNENYTQTLHQMEKHGWLTRVDDGSQYTYEDVVSSIVWDIVDKFYIRDLDNKQSKEELNYRANRGGSFFNYKPTKAVTKPVLIALHKCQIFESILANKEMYKCNCLVYALTMAGVDDDVLDKIMCCDIGYRFLNACEVVKVLEKYGIKVTFNYMDDSAAAKKNCHGHRKIAATDPEEVLYDIGTINIYKEHYFLEFDTGITTSYLVHMTDEGVDPEDCSLASKRWEGTRWRAATGRSIPSSKLVSWLFANKYFKELSFAEYAAIPQLRRPAINEVKNIYFSEKYDVSNAKHMGRTKCPRCGWHPPLVYPECDICDGTPEIKAKFGSDESLIWFADFEAYTGKDSEILGNRYKSQHKPFCLCAHNYDGSKKLRFWGDDCAERLLEALPNKAIVFFHNLAYDARFLAHYGAFGKAIQKSRNKIYSMFVRHQNKVIMLKDSLAMINAKLEKFPSMFGLDAGVKEVFPYDYYNETVCANGNKVGDIALASAYLHNGAHHEFIANIDKIGARIDANHFDMEKYAMFYCDQDVNILRQGYKKFRQMILDDLHIDILYKLTAPALAHQYFVEHVYKNNTEIKCFSGIVREFIGAAVTGGRCMTAYNRKWYTNCDLVDFDAVSLYPSAMARLKIPLGSPKVLTKRQCNMDFLSKQDAYIVQITITANYIHHAFPIIRQPNEHGAMKWCDYIVKPVTMYVSNIYLEDIIKYYPGIQFSIEQGYYWNQGVDTTMQTVIRNVFNRRIALKKAGNPLQEVYKLIMNSSYGKTIQKFVENEIVYKSGKAADRFRERNHQIIVSEVAIQGTNDMVAFTIRKAINKQFSFPHIGVLILDMSKRIMNEVMYLAEELGLDIYYQDTDSMHIRKDQIETLATAFEERYGRKLIGKDMGQFHGDFDGGADHAVESYFICPKVYIDKLDNGTYHIRGKGLTRESIDAAASGAYLDLYKRLYNGESIKFDMLAGGKPSFDMGLDMTIHTRANFTRKICSKLYVGDELVKDRVAAANKKAMTKIAPRVEPDDYYDDDSCDYECEEDYYQQCYEAMDELYNEN